jgi:predicted RNA methylase
MSRPVSQAKLQFYPIPPPVMAGVAAMVRVPEVPDEITLLDPCAGKGEAIAALARHLSIPEGNVHCVELSDSRSEAIARDFPNYRLLGPATFTGGVAIGAESMSVVYCNPPYADEMGGGGREEAAFLGRALSALAPGGLLIFVVPEDVVLDWRRSSEDIRRSLGSRLDNLAVFAFPPEHRNFGEIVVFGTKRKNPTTRNDGPLGPRDWPDTKRSLAPLPMEGPARYSPVAGRVPRRWAKVDFAPGELEAAVASSPLAEALAPPPPARPASPPLPLGRGHIALLLAGGRLDGVVAPPGEPPHVVRGTASKVRFLDVEKSTTDVDEEGNVTSKEVHAERIVLTVRALLPCGTIRDFGDGPAAAPEAEPAT